MKWPVRLEFFANRQCDPSGFGEGETFIGPTEVMIDGNGNASFTVSFPIVVPAGEFITATATSLTPNPTAPDRPLPTNTSEFSQCVQVSAGTPADAIKALISQVESIPSLNQGKKNSLIRKLDAAQQSLARGNRNAARGQLNAFINEVQALERSGRLAPATADSLIAQAKAIIDRI